MLFISRQITRLHQALTRTENKDTILFTQNEINVTRFFFSTGNVLRRNTLDFKNVDNYVYRQIVVNDFYVKLMQHTPPTIKETLRPE